jgi:hypothetical protein
MMKPYINFMGFIYSRVIIGLQWLMRCSMLLYLDGTAIPMKVIIDIQLMVRWRVLVVFGPQSHNGRLE